MECWRQPKRNLDLRPELVTMPAFHNLGNHQPYFKITIPEKDGKFFSSRVSTHDINNRDNNKSFYFCWLKVINKKGIKTINKVPQRKNWPNLNQKEISAEELLKKYQEYWVRTGTKLGNKYFEGVDIDIGEKLSLLLLIRAVNS